MIIRCAVGFASEIILLSLILVTGFILVKKKSAICLLQDCKSILVASVPSWIPRELAVVGAHLGTAVVFETHGANQAGAYFIAMAIFYAFDAIKNSLFFVAFPVLSATDDQRKRYVVNNKNELGSIFTNFLYCDCILK